MSLPENPKHGDHDPEHGWYSEPRKGWISDPSKIGRVVDNRPPEPSQAQKDQYASSKMSGNKFYDESPELEKLIKLRDSDRAEDRQAFASIATGTTRISLGLYEQQKAKLPKRPT